MVAKRSEKGEGLPKFQGSAKFSTRPDRIAWNVASDQRRSFAQNRNHLNQLQRISPRHQEDPDMMRLHYQEILQQGLDHLSLEDPTVLVLHDLEQQSQKDIAEIPQWAPSNSVFFMPVRRYDSTCNRQTYPYGPQLPRT